MIERIIDGFWLRILGKKNLLEDPVRLQSNHAKRPSTEKDHFCSKEKSLGALTAYRLETIPSTETSLRNTELYTMAEASASVDVPMEDAAAVPPPVSYVILSEVN